MEKRTPHYNLGDVKSIILELDMDAFTSTAKNNTRLMGLDGQAALDEVLGLQRSMLFKSMTTHTDSRGMTRRVSHALSERQNCLHQGDDTSRCDGDPIQGKMR